MTTATSAGGPGAIGGFNFQHALSAWAACHVLAEQAVSLRWDLPSPTFFTFIRCETEQPLDDLMIGGSDHGLVLMQISTKITRSEAKDSKLASALAQCVRQLNAYSTTKGTKPWERTLNQELDRMVLATDHDAPQWFKTDLPELLQRFRNDTALISLGGVPATKDEAETARIVDAHFQRLWLEITSSHPTKEDTRRFYSLLRTDHFDFTENGRDRESATNVLRQAVLRDATAAEAVFRLLERYCAELAKTRDGADRPRLQEYLRRQPTSFHVKEPRSYKADIETLKAQAKSTAGLLEALSVIHFSTALTDIRIRRSANDILRTAMLNEGGHVIVIGEPGAGKSGIVHSFTSGRISNNEDTVYISADRISSTNAHGLQSEWRLDHPLLDILRNWPGDSPGFVVIDALDAARSEDTARLLRETLTTIIKDGGRWQVIASMRKYDLRYSDDIQILFQGSPLDKPISDPEFQNVRHLNVRQLDDSELAQVQAQSSQLETLLVRARSLVDTSLLALLRSPFNLQLAARLLAIGIPVDEIAPMQSRIELLELYWRHRVNSGNPDGHGRDQVCRLICEDMVRRKLLRADASCIPHSASEALHTLKVNGVLVEWQAHSAALPDHSVLAFSHNVLFDYATARTLLGGPGNKAKEWMSRDPSILLSIRPSFEMHFQSLWRRDPSRQLFWEMVAETQCDEVPRIGQLIGPAVAAELIRTDDDSRSLLIRIDSADPSSKTAYDGISVHLVGTLLAIKAPDELASDMICTTLLRELSDRISERSAGSIRALLASACEGLKA